MEELSEWQRSETGEGPTAWNPDDYTWDTYPFWRLLPPPQAEPAAAPLPVQESEGPAERYWSNGAASHAAGSNPFAFDPDEEIGSSYRPFADDSPWRLGPVERAVAQWEYEPRPTPDAAPRGTHWKALVQEIAETIVLTLLIFVLMRALIQNYRIEGISMEPNLHEHQYLIVNKLAYYFSEPQRGDIIVFNAALWNNPNDPEKDYIKRIIGLPGDSIECRPNEILVNGEVIQEPYGPNPWSYTCGPLTLGPDEYFVLGDNRPSSQDSARARPDGAQIHHRQGVAALLAAERRGPRAKLSHPGPRARHPARPNTVSPA